MSPRFSMLTNRAWGGREGGREKRNGDAVHTLLGRQRFCICCRHMSGKRDKPTILNTLTSVGVWNGSIFYVYTILIYSDTYIPVWQARRAVYRISQRLRSASGEW